MMPAFLLPEKIVHEDGQGAHVALDQPCGERLELTLGITRILERESLSVAIEGSADGKEWRALAAFPRKSFCGTYPLMLDLSGHRGIKFLRAHWKMHRWNRQESKTMFSFYVWAEPHQPKALRAAS
ncbi:MAG TPA: hypothetical protein VGR73_00240 [Bryobacteraceae bacterium]|nr:hypothetical protein [Bryobacteraceae bacterium]